MLRSARDLGELERRSRQVFGVGLAVLTGPVRFLHETAGLTVPEAKAALREREDKFGKVTQPGTRVELPRKRQAVPVARRNLNVDFVDLSQPPEPKVTVGAPPFIPDPTTEVTKCAGWVWVPSRSGWVAEQETQEVPHPRPSNVSGVLEYGGWIWYPAGDRWLYIG